MSVRGSRPPAMFDSNLTSLELVHRGKVRDIYRIDDAHLLFVATDRISAFDVVLPSAIPDKGRVLTELSLFWFERLAPVIANHLAHRPLEALLDEDERARVAGRSMVVRRLEPLPVEAIVRGYLIGSGFRDYQDSGEVCGITLPPGLEQAQQLPDVLFTPSTKADAGDRDENISLEQMADRVGVDRARQIRTVSIDLYRRAAAHALKRGVIIADTKFEFGLDGDDRLVLMDEVLTPDSSRFWPVDGYRVGISPPSFDKQYVRDHLLSLDWNMQAPAPSLPADVIEKTREKYLEVQRRLVSTAPDAL